MDTKLPPLQWLKSFESSARHSSFTGASEELHLTPAAISHQIRSLEQHLGFKLFTRLPKGLQLTTMGEAYLPPLRKAFDDIETSTIGLFGPNEPTSLTVRVSPSFATLCLAPILNDFRQKHPKVNLRIYTAIWPESHDSEDADIEIRYGDGQWKNWQSEEIGSDATVLVGLTSKYRDQSDRDFLRQSIANGVIQIMGCEALWVKYLRHFSLDESLIHSRTIMTDNSITALEFSSAGMGLALVSKRFVRSYLLNSKLIQPIDFEMPIEQSHYIVAKNPSAKIKPEALIFKQWLLKQFTSN